MLTAIINENGTDFLTIKIPVIRQPSKTGKTLLVATSGGNKQTNVVIDGKPVTIGLNAYISK